MLLLQKCCQFRRDGITVDGTFDKLLKIPDEFTPLVRIRLSLETIC
jgi:hypothetical protein